MTEDALASHRAVLLRHCYRMLGSFSDAEDLTQDVLLKAWRARDQYAGQAPLEHWLMRIATNACLDALAHRRRRTLPRFERPPSSASEALERDDAAAWVSPGPDAKLFATPARALELRESVALAFVALLQRLPPRQRAVLLLKDVVGWSAAEIAEGLQLSLGSVNSALHRARATVQSQPEVPPSQPPPAGSVDALIRCWESHDLEGLVALMREDIIFSMPPFGAWFQGRDEVVGFLRSPVFTARWAPGFRVTPTRANGELALAFHRREGDAYRASSVQIVRFVDKRIGELLSFIGPQYHLGFDLPDALGPRANPDVS